MFAEVGSSGVGIYVLCKTAESIGSMVELCYHSPDVNFHIEVQDMGYGQLVQASTLQHTSLFAQPGATTIGDFNCRYIITHVQ